MFLDSWLMIFDVVDKASRLYNWFTGVSGGQQMQAVLAELERTKLEVRRLSDHLLYAPTVQQAISFDRTTRLADEREIRVMLNPLAEAMNGDLLATSVVSTPERLRNAFERDPWEVLIDVRPLDRAKAPANADLVPVVFRDGERLYVGWQTRGALPILLNCEFKTESKLWLPASDQPHFDLAAIFAGRPSKGDDSPTWSPSVVNQVEDSDQPHFDLAAIFAGRPSKGDDSATPSPSVVTQVPASDQPHFDIASIFTGEDARRALIRVPDLPGVVRRVLEQFTPKKALYLAPDIPQILAMNAALRCQLPADERILALLDCTLFGSAKNALIFGSNGLYMHNRFLSPSSGAAKIDYKTFANGAILVGGTAGEVSVSGTTLDVAGAPMSTRWVMDMLESVRMALAREFSNTNSW